MRGLQLKVVLLEGGIEPSELLILPPFACRANHPAKDKDERKATQCCKPLVTATLAKVDPATPVLLAGKWSMLAVAGREKGLGKVRGFRDDKWRIGDEPRKEEEDE